MTGFEIYTCTQVRCKPIQSISTCNVNVVPFNIYHLQYSSYTWFWLQITAYLYTGRMVNKVHWKSNYRLLFTSGIKYIKCTQDLPYAQFQVYTVTVQKSAVMCTMCRAIALLSALKFLRDGPTSHIIDVMLIAGCQLSIVNCPLYLAVDTVFNIPFFSLVQYFFSLYGLYGRALVWCFCWCVGGPFSNDSLFKDSP